MSHSQSSITCCLLVFLVLSIVHGYSTQRRYYRKYERSNSSEFDVLIFTQRWPQTVCFTWKETSDTHSCTLPRDDDEWTIHGIWPSIYREIGPQFCNTSMPFNATALKPLESQLKEKWMDIHRGEDPYSFWKHEWNKHGTCAAILKQFNTQFKYFSNGLSMLNTYDMRHVLAKANILPGKDYTMQDIFNGIERVLGKRGEVICVKDQKTSKKYIFEIRLCFDKKLQLIDCDGVYEYPSNCGRSAIVTYPGKVPESYRVVQI